MNNIKPACLLLLYSYGPRLFQNKLDHFSIDEEHYRSLTNEEDKLNYVLKQLPLNSLAKSYFKDHNNQINSTLSLHLFVGLNVYEIYDSMADINLTDEYYNAFHLRKKEFQSPIIEELNRKKEEEFLNTHVICCEEVLYQIGEDLQNMKKLYFCAKCKKEYKLNSFDIKTSGVLYRNED